MKKFTSITSIILFLIVAVPVFAANNGTGMQGAGSQQGTTTQTQQRLISPSPTGKTIQNQNQVKTQNAGEDTKIQTNTQEQETEQMNEEIQGQGLPKAIAPRSETALEHMSNVASKVEELLTTKTMQGGIGEQVREIAQEQKTAQQQMQMDLEKVDSRKGLLKSLIGPDFQVLRNMLKIMGQNELRIQRLTQLKNQLINKGDMTKVQETIQALMDQNTVLQQRINLEEQSGSLLGWLLKLFVK